MRVAISSLMIFFLMVYPVSAAVTYKDVPANHWAYEAINKLTETGVITGYSDGSFKPNNKTTREHFAIVFTKYFGLKLNEKAGRTFDDVNYNHKSFLYIDAAKSFIPVHNRLGFTFRFDPDLMITREDAAKAIVSVLKLDKAQKPDKSYITAKFKDYRDISPELREYVAIASYYGILNGNSDGYFRGKAGLSRAELCVLLNNIAQKKLLMKEAFKPVQKPWTIKFINFQRSDYEKVRDFPGYNETQSFYGKITSVVNGVNNSHYVVTYQTIENEEAERKLSDEKVVHIYVTDKDLNLFKIGEWVIFYYDRDNNVISYNNEFS